MPDFLRKIQEGDEAAKRRWLVASSLVAMALVVFVWLNYFNALVQPAGTPPPPDGVQGLTFWQTFKAGLKIVAQGIGGEIKSLWGAVRAPKSYNIQP